MKYSDGNCGRFSLFWDMNADGVVTISDFFQWIRWVWNLPAKLVTEFVAGWHSAATFFEIDCGTGELWGGAAFSFVVWLIVFNLIAIEFGRKN